MSFSTDQDFNNNYSFIQDSKIENTVTNNTNNTNKDTVYKEKESVTNAFDKTVETQSSGEAGTFLGFGFLLLFGGIACFFLYDKEPEHKDELIAVGIIGVLLGPILIGCGIAKLVGAI